MARLIFTIEEMANKIIKDDIVGYAAQSSYYLILSFFPFIALLLSLIHLVPVEYDTFISFIYGVVPYYFMPTILDIFNDLYNHSSVTLTSISAIGTLWAAGSGFTSLMKGFNGIMGSEEKRNFIIRRIISSFHALVFIVLIIISLVFIVFGNFLLELTSEYLPYVAIVIESILHMKLLLYPALLTLIFTFMFKFILTERLPLIRHLPGAFITSIGWYGFSELYAIYFKHSNYSIMYGSIATLILAMIWLYFCMIILFFGVEFNSFIQDGIFSTSMFKTIFRSGKK